MKIDGTEPEKPKPVGQRASAPRIEPVTEAEMAGWSARRRDEWADLSEEDRVLWKLIYDEMKGLMDEEPEPSEQAPAQSAGEDFDVDTVARGLFRALMEEWQYDSWERAQEQEEGPGS